MTSNLYSKGSCALVCFNVAKRDSFSQVETWFKAIDDNCKENIPRVLVACLIDREDERVVTPEEG